MQIASVWHFIRMNIGGNLSGFRWENTTYLAKILLFVVKKVEGHLLEGRPLLGTIQ